MLLEQWLRVQGHGALARLARDADLAYNTVHEIATGKRRARTDSALAIQAATSGEVTLDDLAGMTIKRPKRAKRRPRKAARPRTRAKRTRRAA